MGRVSICQKNCNTIDLRRAQVNEVKSLLCWSQCLNQACWLDFNSIYAGLLFRNTNIYLSIWILHHIFTTKWCRHLASTLKLNKNLLIFQINIMTAHDMVTQGVRASTAMILTRWGRDQIDTITQTTFLSAFFWTKMFELRLKFHWSLFLRVQLTKFHHWFR